MNETGGTPPLYAVKFTVHKAANMSSFKDVQPKDTKDLVLAAVLSKIKQEKGIGYVATYARPSGPSACGFRSTTKPSPRKWLSSTTRYSGNKRLKCGRQEVPRTCR